MIAVANSNVLTKASPLFLFSDKEALYKQGDILGSDWLGSDGKMQGLLPNNML